MIRHFKRTGQSGTEITAERQDNSSTQKSTSKSSPFKTKLEKMPCIYLGVECKRTYIPLKAKSIFFNHFSQLNKNKSFSFNNNLRKTFVVIPKDLLTNDIQDANTLPNFISYVCVTNKAVILYFAAANKNVSVLQS